MGLYRLFVATVEHDAVTDEPVAPLITFRRDLHAHPELRFTETRTAQRIAAAVAPFADTVITGIGGTGVLARVDGEEPGDLVLIRADIDAYPVADAQGRQLSVGDPGRRPRVRPRRPCNRRRRRAPALRRASAPPGERRRDLPAGRGDPVRRASGASVVLADAAMAKISARERCSGCTAGRSSPPGRSASSPASRWRPRTRSRSRCTARRRTWPRRRTGATRSSRRASSSPASTPRSPAVATPTSRSPSTSERSTEARRRARSRPRWSSPGRSAPTTRRCARCSGRSSHR